MIWQVDGTDPRCLTFVDQHPRSGFDNMELDSHLLEFVCQESVDGKTPPTVCRIYRWDTPTVTLGYFQDQNADVPAEIEGCPKVKRLTGGGAILHDLELTYSVIVPSRHSVRHQPLELYNIVHAAIVKTLAKQGVVSCMRQDSSLFAKNSTAEQKTNRPEPFLCFLRHDDRDIVIGEHKIVGSAQRRRKGSVLQHGSILLNASHLVPEVVGLHDLVSKFNSKNLARDLGIAISEAIAPKTEIIECQHDLRNILQILT